MAMSLATEMLDAYITAEKAVLSGQSFRLGDRMLTRTNLQEIIAGRKEWERKVAGETAAAAGRSNAYAVADFSRGAY